MVEMIFDDVLAAAGDEDELLDAGFFGFFDGVLHDRFVDNRQHLFGDCLGRGKEARPHARDRKNGFSDWLWLGHGAPGLCPRLLGIHRRGASTFRTAKGSETHACASSSPAEPGSSVSTR